MASAYSIADGYVPVLIAKETATVDTGLTSRKRRLTATIPEVSELLDLHPKSGYALAATGSLPVPVFRAGRRVLVSRHHLEELLGPAAVALVLDGDETPTHAIAS
jgi:hypothetical protein